TNVDHERRTAHVPRLVAGGYDRANRGGQRLTVTVHHHDRVTLVDQVDRVLHAQAVRGRRVHDADRDVLLTRCRRRLRRGRRRRRRRRRNRYDRRLTQAGEDVQADLATDLVNRLRNVVTAAARERRGCTRDLIDLGLVDPVVHLEPNREVRRDAPVGAQADQACEGGPLLEREAVGTRRVERMAGRIVLIAARAGSPVTGRVDPLRTETESDVGQELRAQPLLVRLTEAEHQVARARPEVHVLMERHIIALEIGVRVRHVRTETDARGEPEGELAAEQPVRVEAYIRILATQLVIAQQRAIPRVAAIDTEI